MMKLLTLAFVGLLFCSVHQIYAQTTEFTYQGSLKDAGNPASGNYDFEFLLFDSLSGGSQVGSNLPKSNVAVSNGIFTVKLDFGAAFPGAARFMEIRVKLAGQSGFTTLSPRQSVSSAPYSITAGEATSTNLARLTVPNTAFTATAVPVVNSGFITAANVTSGGSGYAAAPAVTVNDATGSGAVLTANVSSGSVTSLTVQNPGSGYSSGASLTLDPPPSNASQTFVTPNFFTGVNEMNNPNNTFAGSFTGNGSGLQNVIASDSALLGGLLPNRFLSTDKNGNVGIGTSSPLSKLDVRTPFDNYGVTHSDGTVTVGSYVGAAGGWFGTKSNHPLHFFTNDGFPSVTVDQQGGVAIGTNPTDSKLAVAGVIESTAGGVKFPDGSTQTSAAGFDNPAYQPFRAFTNVQGGSLVVVPAGKRLVIESVFGEVNSSGGSNLGVSIYLNVVGQPGPYAIAPNYTRPEGANTYAAYTQPVRIYLSPGQQLTASFHINAVARLLVVSGYYVDLPSAAVKPAQGSNKRGPKRSQLGHERP